MLLEARSLKKEYPVRRFLKAAGSVRALDGVSFHLEPGRTLAIVGESGCGKSTLARLLLRLETPTSGELRMGEGVGSRGIQMVFQDPYGSLNPRRRLIDLIADPLRVYFPELSKQDRHTRALKMMEQVGLRTDQASRYPHQLSGGQRQRVGIARALILEPRILVLDEPISALDLSIQAQVMNLLIDLQRRLGLSYVFISHDLGAVRHLADHVLVMYLGKVVESGDAQTVLSTPRHPYTRALLASAPVLRGRAVTAGLTDGPVRLSGELPSPLNPPTGCALHRRCPLAGDRCRDEVPSLQRVDGREVACWVVV